MKKGFFCSGLMATGLGLGLVLLIPNQADGQSSGVYREVYSGIEGSAVINLTTDLNFPNNPTSAGILTNGFEAPTNVEENYGQRCRALLVAPTTGNYTFWIASDDASELYLSTDETAGAKSRIAYVSSWTGSREWTKEANQQSAAISLVAGRRYYLEALHKEGTGGDNLAVRWQLPGGTIEEPIPALRLIPATERPGIASQPTNTTVVENSAASFTVIVSNGMIAACQWQRANTNIPNATNATFTLNPAALTDNGANFRCLLTNALGAVTSTVATLTVTADTNKPVIVLAQNVGTNSVVVTFSEPVEASSGTNKANYAITNGITVTAAAFGSDTKTVVLTTTLLARGSNYTLVVNNVRDRAATPNTILPNSTNRFSVSEYTPQDIGSPAQAGGDAQATGGLDITAGGADIFGSSDQFHFSYTQRTGDFDMKARVAQLNFTDVWAKAGLMARETLNADSRYAATFATPTLSGTYFQYRSATAGAATLAGSVPANYPNTWLRLQRTGTTLKGYAGYDGQTWMLLGSVDLSGLPSTIYFGMAVVSHNTTNTTVAQFRDMTNVVGAVQGQLPRTSEPLGPSSRKTGMVLSEIMYKPAPRADTNNLEFIEIFNSNPFYEDLSGWRISGDVDFKFPAGTILRGGEFLVIAASPASIRNVYGISNVTGPYTNSLRTSGTIRLRNDLDAILLEINYDNKSPWPVGADETGHSLVLARPSYGEGYPQAWAISDVVGGSPGRMEAVRYAPERNVVINEILAHTDPPLTDYLELYNHSNQAVDLSGCFLSDDPTTNKFTLPNGTSIPARGFLVFYATNLGFNLSADGETIYFRNAANDRVLEAVDYRAQLNGVSAGRCPDGAAAFYPLALRTPGTGNGVARFSEVVINEIMYRPMSGLDDGEYVELYNRGASAVDLTRWRFTDGLDFVFPSNTVIAANGYLVVAKNAAQLMAAYAHLGSANTVGDYDGSLGNRGERLALAMPESVVTTNGQGWLKTNTIYVEVDEVTFGVGGRWGHWANEGGSSLELMDPRANRRLADNWADSDETRKQTNLWTYIEAQGLLDNGSTYNSEAIDRLEITMLGEGECLLDNVEVIGPNGTNLLTAANSDFESGLGNWVPQGNHLRSTLETTEGYYSGKSLHIRASDRGDTGANRIRVAMAAGVASGQTATIRAKARWLSGWPEIVLRLKGNYLEAYGRLSVPPQPGTPGLPNSRLVSNRGPALYEIVHTPAVPAASENVVVTARVQDPDGVAGLLLKYRIDPNTTYSTVTMLDNGTGGDAVANDGIFSATIPGQASGTLAAFYLQATDAAATPAVTVFPSSAPTRECVVMFGEATPSGSFGVYRYWLTQNAVNTWISRPSLSNERVEGTLVYGNFRVIYNIAGKYAGSPYHQGYSSPSTGNCQYNLALPLDDLLLGTDNFNKLHMPGNGPGDDSTCQGEQISYWLAHQIGLPFNYRRYVHLYVNGNHKGKIMEDSQVPGAEVVEENFPEDPDGNLYKLQPWFEFDNITVSGSTAAGFNNKSWCTLNNYTTLNGVKKTARYRPNYLVRAAEGTANNYNPVFTLVDIANTYGSAGYITNMEALIDMEQWMRTFALEHAVGNWDSVGYQNAQNMYGYKPRYGKWKLLIWDLNHVLGVSGGSHPSDGSHLFDVTTPDVAMQQIYQTPTFRRIYYRALKELALGPMTSTSVGAVMDARYNAFVANGVTASAPTTAKTWIANMRNAILNAVNVVPNAFAITSNGGNSFNTASNLVQLAGVAMVEVTTIRVNGVAYQPSWSTLTNWTLWVPLPAAANALTVVGYNYKNQAVAGASDTITVNYTGTVASPQQGVVINEIMYNPVLPDTSYVEIYNTSTSFHFDLSNWRLDGVDFTFPEGSVLMPGGFFVVAAHARAFAAVFPGVPVVGEFAGNLDNGGETLRLVKPGSIPEWDEVVDEVRYDNQVPWPANADGGGASLQLIDASRDNRRVANWLNSSSWRFASYTGPISGVSNLLVLPGSVGEIYLDDVMLNYGSTPGVGPNLIRNGDFESPLASDWTVSTNATNSYISTLVKRSGNSALRLIATAMGTAQVPGLIQGVSGLTGGTYTISFWYLPSTNLATLTMRFSSAFRPVFNVGGQQQFFSPGAANSVAAALPEFPLVWLNEAQPQNLTGPMDNFNERDPWLELFNSGTNALSLDGWFLADNYTNLTQWAFPAGLTIGPGQYFVVWADGQPAQTSGTNVHTSFRLAPDTGQLALVVPLNGVPTLLDYLNYRSLAADRSYGAYPNGHPFQRQMFFYVTPGGPNNPVSAPVPVVINEWMADNAAPDGIPDPADGLFQDWFELYNPNSSSVDLSGYYLTDSLASPFKWPIPAGTRLQGFGHLLVWADNDTGQNGLGTNGDLHANFQLNAEGEAIGLFAPDGTLQAFVVFGRQSQNVSQGRYPDASTNMVSFTNATPRGFNYSGTFSNLPPALAPVGNRTINEGTVLTFTNRATDADVPAQTLTFSLDPGAPAGAAINPTNGVFLWATTEGNGPGSYLVTIRVTDSGFPTMSVSETIVLLVSEVNSPPVLNPIGNKSVNEGSLLTFTATASDPDLPANTLTFSLDAGAPAGAAINPISGVFSWTPVEGQGAVSYPITLRVTDNGPIPYADTETILVTVNAINQPPVISSMANLSVNEGDLVAFTVPATDPDHPANVLTFAMSGAPAGATLDSAIGAFNWTPSEAQGPSTNTIVFRVTDDGLPSLSATQTLILTIHEVNTAPVLGLIGNRTAKVGQGLTFTATASDPDWPTNTLTFSLDAGQPAGATINSASGVFAWTPSAGQAGSNWITVRVTDNGTPPLSDSEAVLIVVGGSNSAPVLAAISNSTVLEGQLLTFTNTATDSDVPAQILTYSLAAGAPAEAVVNASSGVFTWTPATGQSGSNYTISVRVTDNGAPPLSDTKTFTVSVIRSNRPPVLASLPAQTIVEGVLFSLPLSASDPDAPPQQLAFALVSGPTGAALDASGLFTWTPGEAQGPSTNTVVVRVSDNGSPVLSATNTLVVIVLESNLPPVLGTLANRSGFALQTISFPALATDPDLPAQSLTFTLDPGAPAGAAISPAGLFSWTPTRAQAGTTNVLTVRVTDNGQPPLSDSRNFTVVIGVTNTPPMLAPIADRVAIEGVLLTFTNQATDEDLPPQTLTFSFNPSAPGNSFLTPDTGVFTWAPLSEQVGTTNHLTIRVTDNGQPPLSATQSFTVVVVSSNALPAPLPQVVNTVEEIPVLITLGPPTNAAGQVLSYAIVSGNGPRFGSYTYAAFHRVIYSPATNFNGYDTFLFTVSNGRETATPAMVTVVVEPRNDVAPYLFGPPAYYGAGSQPAAVASGDFIKDLKADLAVANAGSGTVSLLAGDGLGGFNWLDDLAVGGAPAALALADFNKDTLLDLAVADAWNGWVSVWFGGGDGNFSQPFFVNTGGQPAGLAVADFNKDARLDLAVANWSDGVVNLVLGNSMITFAAPVSLPVGSNPVAVAAADFNKDLKPDLVVVNQGDNTVCVLLGNGVGQFGSPMVSPVGLQPGALTIGDFNNDTRPDVAVANGGSGEISVLIAGPSGALSNAVSYFVGGQPSALAAADFDKDGKVDLAVADAAYNSVTVLLGNGNGTFANYYTDAGVYYPVGLSPAGLVTNDFNKDGNVDLGVAQRGSDDLSVLLNNRTPRAYPQSLQVLEDQAVAVTLTGSAGPLTFRVTLPPTNGTLSGSAPDLEYRPNPNAIGKDRFDFVAEDGRLVSAAARIAITILPVNDPPSFTLAANSITVAEDSGTYRYYGFVTSVSKGPANERSQTFKYQVNVDNPGLFSIRPALSGTGLLTFTPLKNAYGMAAVTATVRDSGGTAFGGQDTSDPQLFTLVVTNVNDPPFLSTVSAQTIYEDNRATFALTVGDLETPPANLLVTVTSTNQALVPDSSLLITPSNNWRWVQVSPLPDAFGKTLLTFRVTDGTNAASRTAVLSVTAINDAPSFVLVTNLITVPAQSATFTNWVIASASRGPTNEASQTLSYLVSNPDPYFFAVAPTLKATGALTFKPKAGITGSVTLGLTAKDTGGTLYGGQNLSSQQYLTIKVGQ